MPISGVTPQSENGFTAAWGLGLEYMFTDISACVPSSSASQGVGSDATTGRTKIDHVLRERPGSASNRFWG